MTSRASLGLIIAWDPTESIEKLYRALRTGPIENYFGGREPTSEENYIIFELRRATQGASGGYTADKAPPISSNRKELIDPAVARVLARLAMD